MEMKKYIFSMRVLSRTIISPLIKGRIGEIIILFLAMLALVGCASPASLKTPEALDPATKLPLDGEHETVILAKAFWQDSGVVVERGAYYDIRAEGRWSIGPICGWTDASGVGVSPLCSGGSVLIGKIGKVGESFTVGKHLTLRPEQEDILYLRAADDDKWVFVNSGSMRVRIKKEHLSPKVAVTTQPFDNTKPIQNKSLSIKSESLFTQRYRSHIGAASGIYSLEQSTTFNVLDKVVFDPEHDQITLIGHYGDQYKGLNIPYLQHLATLLEHPRPEFSLNWTRESEKRVDDLFRRLDSDAEMDKMVSQWGHWLDENDRITPMGRAFMPLYGITPANNRYEIIASILRAVGNERGADVTLYIGELQRIKNTPQESQAGIDFILKVVPPETIQKIGAKKQSGEISLSEVEMRLGRAFCTALDNAFHLTNQPVLRVFDQSIQRGQDLGTAITKALGEIERQLHTVLSVAMGELFRRHRHNQIQVPPEVIRLTTGVSPEVMPEYIGMDSRSQLARVMFEADYLGKQLPNRVDLEKKIPRYKTIFSFEQSNPAGSSPGTTQHMWITVEKLDVAQSPTGRTLETRGATMRFNIREMIGGRSIESRPGLYEELLTSLYDDLALEFPVLHELREIAKLRAAAQWIKKRKPNIRLPSAGRVAWNGPAKVPGLIYFTWTPNPRPGRTAASMMAMGGISFNQPARPIHVDSSVVDLRLDRLVAKPESGPEMVADILRPSFWAPIPRPVGWVTEDTTEEGNVTAVTIDIGNIERDAPAEMRLGEDLLGQAVILWKMDDLERAEQIYRDLIDRENDPVKKASIMLTMAQLLKDKGDNAAAVRTLEEAIRLAPDAPQIQAMLQLMHAQALDEEGDRRGAIEALKGYLSIHPDNLAAAGLLAEMEDAVRSPRSSLSGKMPAEGNIKLIKTKAIKQAFSLASEGGVRVSGFDIKQMQDTAFDIPVPDVEGQPIEVPLIPDSVPELISNHSNYEKASKSKGFNKIADKRSRLIKEQIEIRKKLKEIADKGSLEEIDTETLEKKKEEYTREETRIKDHIKKTDEEMMNFVVTFKEEESGEEQSETKLEGKPSEEGKEKKP